MLSKKKTDTKGHILYDSNSKKCPQEAIPQRQKANQWLPGAWRRELWGVTADGYEIFGEDDDSVLKSPMAIVTQLQDSSKTYFK